MTTSHVIPFVVLFVYLIVLAVIIIRTPKVKKDDFDDYYTGSRNMGSIVVGLVLLVTYYTGTTWTGWTGFTALEGVFGAYLFPYATVCGIAMYMFATRVWPLGKKYKLSTIADIYELRYHSKMLKVVSGVFFVLVGVCSNVTTELVTMGLVLNVMTYGAIPRLAGSIVFAIFMIIYILWGGIKSIARVDTLQAIIMVIGAVGITFYLIFANYGSVSEMFSTALAVQPESFTIQPGSHASWFSFVFVCSVGVLCYPELYVKMFMAKSINAVKESAIYNAVGAVWSIIIVFGGFVIIGFTAAPIDDVEQGFLLISQYAGPVVFSLACLFILAATMGTIDGSVLAYSGLFTRDVVSGIRRLRKKAPYLGEEGVEAMDVSAKDEVRITRIMVVVMILIGLWVGSHDIPLLVYVFMYVYQFIGLAMVPLMGALLWKRATAAGAWSSLAVGVFGLIALIFMGHGDDAILPGVYMLIISAVVFVVVSLLTYKPEGEEAKTFEKIRTAAEEYKEA